MDKLGSEINYHFYLSRPTSDHDTADFTFVFHQPLNVGAEKQYYLDIKECILPKIRMFVDEGYLVVNEKHKIRITFMYISNLTALVQHFNSLLPENFASLQYNDRDRITLTLHQNQNLRVSENYANLLFEGKTVLTNKSLQDSVFVFKTRHNYETGVYYLTCNLLPEINVNKTQMTLVSSLVVRYEDGATQSNLFWENDNALGKTYFKAGYHSSITFQIKDERGNFVKLKNGLFFIHIKVCT